MANKRIEQETKQIKLL